MLHVVYLIFTEGHSSTAATELMRADLCDEAIWLADLLAGLVPDEADVLGLAALLRLTDARRLARVDEHGRLVLLEDQDRERWDRMKIDEGLDQLRAAHETGSEIGPYTLQAGVAAVHSLAANFDETDWCAILEIYNRLAIEAGTMVVLLNRAIALSYVRGPEVALDELDALAATERLDSYQYLHSARADLLQRLGRRVEALQSYERARTLCDNAAEQAFLDHRIAALS